MTGTVPHVAPSSGPAGHLPPRGKVRRVKDAAPYMVCCFFVGRDDLGAPCHFAPAESSGATQMVFPLLPPLGFGGGPKK